VPTGSRVAYLDASTIVKLVVDEPESGALRDALDEWPRRVSSRVSVVEVLRAVRLRDPRAEPLAREVLGRTRLMAIGDAVLVAATHLEPRSLRALDAIHIASATRLGPSLAAFVSYDRRQLEAAATAGLPVTSPS
jgi:predicted nucleic acid-binding protein